MLKEFVRQWLDFLESCENIWKGIVQHIKLKMVPQDSSPDVLSQEGKKYAGIQLQRDREVIGVKAKPNLEDPTLCETLACERFAASFHRKANIETLKL
jgi:hypothetical protein